MTLSGDMVVQIMRAEVEEERVLVSALTKPLHLTQLEETAIQVNQYPSLSLLHPLSQSLFLYLWSPHSQNLSLTPTQLINK